MGRGVLTRQAYRESTQISEKRCEGRQKCAILVKFVFLNSHLDAFISVHVFDSKFLTLQLYFWVENLAIATQKFDIFIIYFMQ